MMIKIKHMEVVVLTLAPFSNLLVMHSCMFLNAVHIDVKVKIARHESIFPLSLFFWKALIMIFLCCTYGVTEKEERSFIFEGGGVVVVVLKGVIKNTENLLDFWFLEEEFTPKMSFLFFLQNHHFFACYIIFMLHIKK